MRRFGALLLAIGSLLSLLGLAGVANALWSTSASGSATIKSVTALPLTAVAIPSPLADLFPGISGALQLTITNPNPYAVSVTAATYGAVTSSDPTNCPSTNLTVGAGGTLGTPIAVGANSTSSAISIPTAATLALSAPNGCQGVTFTVTVTLTGTQA